MCFAICFFSRFCGVEKLETFHEDIVSPRELLTFLLTEYGVRSFLLFYCELDTLRTKKSSLQSVKAVTHIQTRFQVNSSNWKHKQFSWLDHVHSQCNADRLVSNFFSGGNAATAIISVPSNFSVPSALVCRVGLTSNWEFFKEQWQDYRVATGLDQKSQAIRVATFRWVMDCLQIFLNLGTEEIRQLSALEVYFLPKRNVV